MPSNALFQIRATRSNPPGRAPENKTRRRTYGAALAQFDELMAAARAVGPAARPLPLFYALSQAGRAIAAAHSEEPWLLRGHGLTSKSPSKVVLDTMVVPDDEASEPPRGTIDSFRGVAASNRSPVPSRAVSLRELWSSLPEAFGLLRNPGEAVPLVFVPEVPDSEFAKAYNWTRAQGAIVWRHEPDLLEEHLRTWFPSTEGFCLPLNPAAEMPGAPTHETAFTPHGYGVRIYWPADENVPAHYRVFARVAPGSYSDARWLRPAVGGVELSPLMTWWMLLYGLSMLARYEPDVWVAALDYDKAEDAAGLAQLLEVARERLPGLVLDALNGERTSYQPSS